MSSTPNISFVPSVAIAAVEEKTAGTTPAATAIADFLISKAFRAVFVTNEAVGFQK
jgi:hypothetical protein